MQTEKGSREALSREIERLRQRVCELEAAQRHRRQPEESYLLEMAQQVDDVFWVFDWQAQKVIFVSGAYERLWGRSAQSLYDRYEDWIDSVHPDDRKSVAEALANVARTGAGEPQEYRIIQPDGAIRWVSDRTYAIRDKTGGSSGFCVLPWLLTRYCAKRE